MGRKSDSNQDKITFSQSEFRSISADIAVSNSRRKLIITTYFVDLRLTILKRHEPESGDTSYTENQKTKLLWCSKSNFNEKNFKKAYIYHVFRNMNILTVENHLKNGDL